MKLHDLFENKKEIKNRNPIAQELRANPQFKAKTEIDKKKEVKKGYQKHKGKVEEASGYQGQSEPTYHVFKNADIKKIVDTIKAKNLRAYPEKTADGVKVHTFDLDRSAVAKELGINETMDSEYKEVKAILDKHGITKADDIELGTPAYEELFGYYMDSGEMPYGVMKARTGMPDEWIVNRLDDLDLVEQVQEDDTTYVKMVIQKYPQEWQKFLQTGDLMDAPNIYEKLFVYFHFDRSEMPYGTAKARDGDPYVWIADKLADLGLTEQVQEDDMSTGTVPVGKKGKTRRATGINDNPYDHNEGEDHPALVNAALWNMKDIYQQIMAGEEIEEDDMFSYGDLIQYLDMSGIPGDNFYEDFIDTVSTAVSQAQPGGFAGQGDAVLVDKKFAPKIKTLYQQFKAATANIKGIKEDVNEADLNAWYAEQYARELAEKDGKVWDKMSYGDKEDYRKIANKKYGVVKSEGADVPTQKGRDAKHDVLTPKAKNKVLQQIKHDANKERRANSKKAVADIEIENESIKKTDYDNMLNVANRNRDADLARIQKLAGIVPMQMQEDYAKMTHELIIKLIKAGKSDQEIQARTGETSKRIEIIRNNIKKETPEATQDLARSLNPFKSAVDTNMSPQLTAKGLDAITKGARPTPNEIKAVEPYVSKLAKAITNPTTAAQVRNVFKKVQ